MILDEHLEKSYGLGKHLHLIDIEKNEAYLTEDSALFLNINPNEEIHFTLTPLQLIS